MKYRVSGETWKYNVVGNYYGYRVDGELWRYVDRNVNTRWILTTGFWDDNGVWVDTEYLRG